MVVSPVLPQDGRRLEPNEDVASPEVEMKQVRTEPQPWIRWLFGRRAAAEPVAASVPDRAASPIIDVSPAYHQLRHDAWRLLEIGMVDNPQNHYGQIGRYDLDDATVNAVRCGLHQILECRGLVPELPFECLGRRAFFGVLELLNFSPTRLGTTESDDGRVIEEVEFTCAYTPDRVTLFNRLPAWELTAGEN